MAESRFDLPRPVQYLQDLCRDILENSVLVDETLCWNKKVSKLDPTSGYDAAKFHLVPTLVNSGFLRKELVRPYSQLGDKLPRELRVERGANYIYIVEQKDQIERLAKDVKAIAKLLEKKKADAEELSFARALDRVRKEIDAHPDPNKFALSVLKKLLPKSD